MTVRQFLTIISLGTGFCFIAWLFILFNVDPTTDTGLGFVFFYTSLLMFLVGLGSLLMFFIQSRMHPKEPIFRIVQRSVALSTGISVLIVLLLLLFAKGILHIWNFTIFLAIVVFFVLFRLSLRLGTKGKRIDNEIMHV